MIKWIKWKGKKKSPVNDNTVVQIKYPDGGTSLEMAGRLRWEWKWEGKCGSDIVAYRIFQEAK